MSEIRDRDEFVLTVNRLMICAMEDIDLGRNEASPTTLDLVQRIEDHDAALRLALETATRERENWIETARTHAQNENYYRSLIDAALKDEPAAYIADDGSISEDVLRAKLPEIVAGWKSRPAPPSDAAREAVEEAREWLRHGRQWCKTCLEAANLLTRLLSAPTPAPPADATREAVITPIRGLRITAAEIRAALKSVMPYGPGQRDEAFVQVAAEAAADALAALSTPAHAPSAPADPPWPLTCPRCGWEAYSAKGLHAHCRDCKAPAPSAKEGRT